MTDASPSRAVTVAEFDDDAAPPRGRSLVEAARRAGATWVVLRVGKDPGGVKATARAAQETATGLVLRVGATEVRAELEDALAPLGERAVPLLRDRLRVVAATERIGKRVRSDVKWAPSAVDVGEFHGGPLTLLRRIAPNRVRAACVADDVVAPWDHLPAAKLTALAAKLATRGGRLWLSEVPPEREDEVRAAVPGVHGVIVRVG